MSSLATILLEHRQRLGQSQEELAATAGLSLRTVQRLEKGERLPRGFTLQALAQALQLPVETLTAAAPASPASPSAIPAPPPAATAVPAYVALLYLSAFSYVLPGLNIVLPLLLRYRKRHVPEIQEAGSRLLNFELVWTLATYGGYFLLLALQIALIFQGRVLPVLLPFGYLFALNVLHAPILLWGAWRARQGHYGGFPVGLRLF